MTEQIFNSEEEYIAHQKEVFKGDKGDKGDSYALEVSDLEEIATLAATLVDVPVVEKVVEKIIEKTEVVKEQPIVTEITKEVENKDTPEQVIEKVNIPGKLIKKERVEGLADIERIAKGNQIYTGVSETRVKEIIKATPAGATVAGSPTEIQVNVAGSLGSYNNFTFDYNTGTFTLPSGISIINGYFNGQACAADIAVCSQTSDFATCSGYSCTSGSAGFAGCAGNATYSVYSSQSTVSNYACNAGCAASATHAGSAYNADSASYSNYTNNTFNTFFHNPGYVPYINLNDDGSASFANNTANIDSSGNISGANLAGTNTNDETQATIKTKLGAAASGVDGYLTGADWTTFNNKVATTRTISTTAPLSGGGDLSANRTLTTSMNTNKLIGRGSASTGVMEEITLGTNISLTGTTLNVPTMSTSPVGNTGSIQVKSSGGAFTNVAGMDVDQTGNTRGSGALDIQVARSAVTQVASSDGSVTYGACNKACGGSCNISIGIGNTSSGSYYGLGHATAVGYANNATGPCATAMGHGNTASASYGKTTAIGYNNSASGAYSAAVGFANSSTAIRSFTFGLNNSATNGSSVAIGYSNSASGYTSAAFGNGTCASGNNSSAFGAGTYACGNCVTAIGYGVVNTTAGSAEFGSCSTAKIRVSSGGLNALTLPINPATLTDAAAPVNAIYYSSTQSKLVYKDAGGVVNNLY